MTEVEIGAERIERTDADGRQVEKPDDRESLGGYIVIMDLALLSLCVSSQIPRLKAQSHLGGDACEKHGWGKPWRPLKNK